MYRKVWDQCKSSVCSIDFISNAGTRIVSFTGFKVKKFLITDNIIEKFAKPAEVMLRFEEFDLEEARNIRMPFGEFMASRVVLGKNHNPGFIIFEVQKDAFTRVPPLLCSKKISHQVGQPIAILGYQLEEDNLSLKKGIVSSMFQHKSGFNTIQVDCTIIQGNAGSPVICAERLEVIGVIGHRLATIADSYRQMMRIMNANLKVLQEAEGKMDSQDIDPIQVLIANQNQIKHLAKEFFLTRSMRVGFAAELCNLSDYCPESEEDIQTNDLDNRDD